MSGADRFRAVWYIILPEHADVWSLADRVVASMHSVLEAQPMTEYGKVEQDTVLTFDTHQSTYIRDSFQEARRALDNDGVIPAHAVRRLEFVPDDRRPGEGRLEVEAIIEFASPFGRAHDRILVAVSSKNKVLTDGLAALAQRVLEKIEDEYPEMPAREPSWLRNRFRNTLQRYGILGLIFGLVGVAAFLIAVL